MDVIWQRLRLRCFTLQYHHLPTSISKISSKDIIFVNKMNNKYIYDSKNSIAWRRRRGSGSCLRDGVPRSRSCLRVAAQLWILAARRRALLWIRYHSQESMKTSTSKGISICHTPVSVHGICFIPFEPAVSWRRRCSGSDITLKNP